MLLKLNPDGNDYQVKSGKSGNRHSGPAGRKARPLNVFRRALVAFSSRFTPVTWCNDNHGNR